MQVAVIGPLDVRTDDLAPVPVPGAEERLLLAVLAAGAPDAVSTDRLIDALWNGRATGILRTRRCTTMSPGCAGASNPVCRRSRAGGTSSAADGATCSRSPAPTSTPCA